MCSSLLIAVGRTQAISRLSMLIGRYNHVTDKVQTVGESYRLDLSETTAPGNLEITVGSVIGDFRR